MRHASRACRQAVRGCWQTVSVKRLPPCGVNRSPPNGNRRTVLTFLDLQQFAHDALGAVAEKGFGEELPAALLLASP